MDNKEEKKAAIKKLLQEGIGPNNKHNSDYNDYSIRGKNNVLINGPININQTTIVVVNKYLDDKSVERNI